MYTDTSDDACRAQLSQEHYGTEFPVSFISHTFMETQQKWSTTEQEVFSIYYTIIKWNYYLHIKWNYYLQGAGITARNDYKPLACFLNGKNTNNKVSRWSLELATYNISFEWISGARNKAADCLSRLVTPTSTTINMLTVFSNDGPAFHTRSHTRTPLTPLQLPTQIQHPRFPKSPLLHQNHSQQNIWMPYFKCKELTHFANAFLEDY